MARRRFRIRAKKVNIPRVVAKLGGTILALYAGGLVLMTLGDVMTNTSSPFYEGLTLIGWTITDGVNGTATSCGDGHTGCDSCINNCVTDSSGAGVLAVVGLIGLASIVMEFIEFRMK